MKIKEDLTGKVFGRLTVTGRDLSKNRKNETSYWYCKCFCGNKRSICRASLIKRNTQSCGCLKSEKAALNAKNSIGIAKSLKEDLIGKVFGKLTVKNRDYTKIGLEVGSIWLCQCECGTIKLISRHNLVNTGTKSCGCLQKTMASQRTLPNAGADRNYWIRKYKSRSKKLGIEFSLSDNEFYDICSMNCYYCGDTPTVRSCGYKGKNSTVEFRANGIDRVESDGGYTRENSVPCCTPCNLMKTDKTLKNFIDRAIKIANKHGKYDVTQKS